MTVIGSESDFLLELRDRMLTEPNLLREYDERKLSGASLGAAAYWEMKNAFLRKTCWSARQADEFSMGARSKHHQGHTTRKDGAMIEEGVNGFYDRLAEQLGRT